MTAAAPPAEPAAARSVRAELDVRRAPLVPVALAATAGILLDRHAGVPLPVSLSAGVVSLLLSFLHRPGPRAHLAVIYLCAGCAAFGAAYHHWWRADCAADDVRHRIGEHGGPARLRGTIDTQPSVTRGRGREPLRSFAQSDATRFVLRVSSYADLGNRRWENASGLVQVHVVGTCDETRAGEEVEVTGRLTLPESPSNPGEFDYASYLRDRGICALLTVREPGDVHPRGPGRRVSPSRWIAAIRGWGQRTLSEAVPNYGALAAALLLGDSPDMTNADWEVYQRTGVIHVLAISGQHLVVLAGFLWVALRLTRVRRRRGAVVVAVVLLLYALVAGGRPPVMRAAWVMAAYCGAVLLLRPIHRGNTFALAWLGVLSFDPTDIFNAGCQLSFLAVAVLTWGVPNISSFADLARLNPFGHTDGQGLVPQTMTGPDPLQRLIDQSRPWPTRMLVRLLWQVVGAYLLNAIIWLAVAPLVAAHYHLVSPVALFLGPPLVLLTSIALFAGFAVLLLAPLAGPLASPFAYVTSWCLAGCEALTQFGAERSLSYAYVPDVPAWWLWPFYAALLVGLASGLVRRYWHIALAVLCVAVTAGSAWLLLGPHRSGDFRCTFLAVGHGGCAVIESPGGRVWVYDVGSVGGPELARRQVAPFLWSRGIRRIDELILSHADLDHFNGIPDLLERFAVGHVRHTPTFVQRDLDAVPVAVGAVERRGVPMHVVSAGDCWHADEVTFQVLHPPSDGPAGKENVRSLVLLVRYRDLSILLTGDLEDAGLSRVLALPRREVDVLMGPHHGSSRSNTPALARWASPRFVVLCQGRSDNTTEAIRAYSVTGSAVLGTWPQGAVTVLHDGVAAQVQTFRTGRQWAVARHGD